MRIGIVGSEEAKFDAQREGLARAAIRLLIRHADLVVSGECHLGGVDIWAREEAQAAGIPFLPCPPARYSWEGGYKQRNLKIVANSDKVVCITVKSLPLAYKGMRFPGGCYHCKTPAEHHIKSGGCWTMHQARRAGKQTELVIIGGNDA